MANFFDQFDPRKTSDPESFKKEYYPAALKAGNELGVDPDILLGKWGNETGWGKSVIPGTFNLGNIKDFSGSGVAATDAMTGSRDKYRQYKSTDEFVDDYVSLIKRKYPQAVGAGKDVAKFTAGLKGYAEDPAYPSKVKASYEKTSKMPDPANFFDQFDEPVAAPKPEAKPTAKPAPKKSAEYERGSVKEATFGESLRDVGQAALGLGSSMVGGMAGLAAEAATAATPLLTDPKPFGLGLDPYKVKQKVSSALSYEPKTEGARKMAEIASIPGQIIGAPLEKATEMAPESLKPVVDIAGNVIMSQVPRMAGAAARRTMVGDEAARAKTRENIAAFKRAEIPQYTLGQVSEGGLTAGAGAPKKMIERQQEQLGTRVEKVADRMSQTKTPEEAGKVIREAIEGTPEVKGISPRKGAAPQMVETGKKVGGYIDNARSMENALYDKMYKVVGRDTQWAYPSLFKALDDMTKQNPNLMATSGGFLNKGILDLRERLVDDVGRPKKLGYEDARWLRSKIGELTDPRQIVPGDTSKIAITPAQADRLYAAISEDMMAGVAKKGPRAELATLKANQFTRQLHHDIGTHLQPVMNQKLLKDVYDSALSGTREGSERVATTMKTLDPTQKDAVRSVFFRELGREGEAWNMKNFMNNYNKLHPSAKEELFGGKGKAKFRNDLDTIAKVADKLTLDENTWHKVKNYMLTEGKLGTMAATAAVTGLVSHSAVAALLAGPAAGFVTGNLVRNPKFVDWFAKSSTKTKGSSIPVLLNQLQSRTKDMSPEDREEVQDYINKVNQNLGAPDESPAR